LSVSFFQNKNEGTLARLFFRLGRHHAGHTSCGDTNHKSQQKSREISK
jgi:hypothetical protein